MHKKNKSINQFVMLQILAAIFCSLKITELFSSVKAKKNPNFYFFLNKVFKNKQGSTVY